MSGVNEMIQLARILEAEWRGEKIDRSRLRDLAERLLPGNPDMRCTLTHVRNRL